MEVTVTPDMYAPSLDANGNYIDNVPCIKNGIFCPCGSRKEKAYDTHAKFSTHTKTKVHQKWLTMLNQNKANYFVECNKARELIENQQKIIKQLENDLQKKMLTIVSLVEKTATPVCTVDFLDIN
jgi:hypothetical protein